MIKTKGLFIISALFLFFVVPVFAAYGSRQIIVNKNLTIMKIINKTAVKDVTPVVYLEQSGGIELPFSPSISRQYDKIKDKLEIEKNGVIYDIEKEQRISLFKAFWTAVKKLFRIYE